MFGGRGGGRGRGRGGGGDLNRRGHPKQLEGPPPNFMPDNILALFRPRPELEYMPPVTPHVFAPSTLTGVAELESLFERGPPPPRHHDETPQQRRERKRAERMAINDAKVAEEIKKWTPADNPDATKEAYKTLLVARLAYETTEKKLMREFESYGPIEKVVIVKDREGKSRGYGFIEFKHEEDMKTAYRRADGKKIDGRAVCVDVERGRTVPDWKPRRLGGGLGDSRRELAKKKRKQDSWYRPYQTEYRVIDARSKVALDVLAQKAIDASMATINFTGIPKVPGYSEKFDRERARADREALKAARLALKAATEAAPGTPEAAAGEGEGVRARSRSRSRERGGDVVAESAAHEAARTDAARAPVEPVSFPTDDGEVDAAPGST